MAARRFLVAGVVQGVGYRAFARRAALRLGLVGWAKNLADGRVEVAAWGPEDGLEALAAELGRGPAFGRVDGICRAEEVDEVGGLTGFEIK